MARSMRPVKIAMAAWLYHGAETAARAVPASTAGVPLPNGPAEAKGSLRGVRGASDTRILGAFGLAERLMVDAWREAEIEGMPSWTDMQAVQPARGRSVRSISARRSVAARYSMTRDR